MTLLVHLIRVRAARRYVMRVRPDGALRVTIPRGGSQAEALRFAERHLDWAVRQRARVLKRGRPPGVEDRGITARRPRRELPPQLLRARGDARVDGDARDHPQSAIALGLVLVAGPHRAQLPADADAARRCASTS